MEILKDLVNVFIKGWSVADIIVIFIFSLSWIPTYLIAKYIIEPTVDFFIPPK